MASEIKLQYKYHSDCYGRYEYKKGDAVAEEEIDITIRNAESLDDIIDRFRSFLLAMTYQPNSIDKYIRVEGDLDKYAVVEEVNQDDDSADDTFLEDYLDRAKNEDK